MPWFLLISECEPQLLLPSIPPIVQWLWVAGSGPKNRPAWLSAVSRNLSSTQPGITVPSFASASIVPTSFMYFEKSMTTATLQH